MSLSFPYRTHEFTHFWVRGLRKNTILLETAKNGRNRVLNAFSCVSQVFDDFCTKRFHPVWFRFFRFFQVLVLHDSAYKVCQTSKKIDLTHLNMFLAFPYWTQKFAHFWVRGL